VVILFTGAFIPYKKVTNSICLASGTIRTEITWFGCFKHEEQSATALDAWLKHREAGFEPTWEHMSTQTYSLLTRTCGTAGTPVIYSFRPMLNDVVAKLSDDRIADLVAILRHGSRDEQIQLIESIEHEINEER